MSKAMRTKINIDDFIILISWVRISLLAKDKKFNYQSLWDQAETYKMKETPLDITIHNIDELMIDAFKIYLELKASEDKVNEAMDMHFAFLKDMMIKETKRFENIVEDILENCKFEDPEIRGIQKGFLDSKMKEYAAVEDYENAARVRDLISMC